MRVLLGADGERMVATSLGNKGSHQMQAHNKIKTLPLLFVLAYTFWFAHTDADAKQTSATQAPSVEVEKPATSSGPKVRLIGWEIFTLNTVLLTSPSPTGALVLKVSKRLQQAFELGFLTIARR